MATRNKIDQIKILRDELHQLSAGMTKSKLDKYSITDDIKALRTEMRDLNKSVSDLAKVVMSIPVSWEKSFFSFRSEMFDKLDKSYIKPIVTLQQETGAMRSRVAIHETKIAKLERQFVVN